MKNILIYFPLILLSILSCKSEEKEVKKSTTPSVPVKDPEGLKIAFYNSDSLKSKYTYFVNQEKIIPTETFFIDDSIQHTNSAKKLGIKTYHLNNNEDIINLFPDIIQ